MIIFYSSSGNGAVGVAIFLASILLSGELPIYRLDFITSAFVPLFLLFASGVFLLSQVGSARAHIHGCTQQCTRVHIYTRAHTCTQTDKYTHTHNTHTHTHIHTDKYTHTRTHTHMSKHMNKHTHSHT